MAVRSASLAGTWYPAEPKRCRSAVAKSLPAVPSEAPAHVLGGLVPHAGWVYSWATAGATFAAIGDPPPDTVVIFGFSHRTRLTRSQISLASAWDTPLGPLPVDRSVADALIGAGTDLLECGDRGHPPGENSIEVLLPFIRHLFPQASFVPISVAADPRAIELGRRTGEALLSLPGRVAVLGSTDLTHYGSEHYAFAPRGAGPEAHRWSKEENDQSFLDRILALDPEGAYRDAQQNRNACGAAAAAAATAAAISLGATGARLLDHTTSWEVRPEGRDPANFVGYASVVFLSQAS